MDHKVSKDMISSGMIPSGEKTQADLGRTQYGSAPSPSSLMEAYKSIYEHHQKDENGNTIPHEGENLEEGRGSSPEQLKQNRAAAADAIKKRIPKKGVMGDFPKKSNVYAGYDLEAKGENNIDENILARIGNALKTKPMQRKPGATSVRQSGANDPRLLKKKQPVTVEKKPEVSTMTRQGKPRTKAQMMAANRIASGKTIADVKASNTQSMRDRARARNAAFKARRAEKKTMMNDVDLFDLIKGRLIDEFYLEEKQALNLMVNLSEVEINEMLGGVKGDGYIGHPRLGIKNPLNPPKKETKKTNGGKGLVNKLGNRATEIERMLNQ